MPPKKTTQKKTEDFFQTIEAGDISLFDLFDQTIAVFGFTKAGKTSLCHYASGSTLRSQLMNGEIILKPTTNKYKTAIVGITGESQTEIPNIFTPTITTSKNVKVQITLLDQPGYRDSEGFHRIFSNGYFHYRTFSKTPKLKFILAFDKIDLSGNGDKIKKAINLFINTFKRYDQIRQQILDATVFLITKVQPKITTKDIVAKLKSIMETGMNNMTETDILNFHNMVNHMINKDKIFIIEKPDQAGVQTPESNILSDIYNRTKFWVRPTQRNVVDMFQINFSVSHEILSELTSFKGNDLFKADFNNFMDYMQLRIENFLLHDPYSFKKIIEMLIKDAIGQIDEHSFLEGMKKFVGKYYKFNEQFKIKRQKTEASLFKTTELDSPEQGKTLKGGSILLNQSVLQERKQKQKETKTVYFIKKFKVLESIIGIFVREADAEVERTVEWLQNISSIFIDIFKKFNTIRITKSDSQTIIFKYSYLIQRLIEEAKIITLILFKDESARQKFDDIKQNMVDIYRPLKDELLNQLAGYNILALKRDYVENIKVETLETVNEEMIKFFQSIPHASNQTKYVIANLVLKYSDLLSKKNKNTTDREKKFAVLKLSEHRNECYSHLQNIKEYGSKREKEEIIEKIFVLSNSLGNILMGFNMHDLARQAYDSVNNASAVFKTFQAQLLAEKDYIEDCRKTLLEYARYASERCRTELAMKCLQDAYSISKTYKEIHEVSQAIANLGTKIPKELVLNAQDEMDKKQDKYLVSLYSETELCNEISPNFHERVKGLMEDFKIEVETIR